jgi:ketosteroid isomerase-like protein
MKHPNEELARSEMEAALRGDFENMLAHYTEDFILHYPGRNALSGTYQGKNGLREWGRKIDKLLGPGGSLVRTLHDILASEDHAIQLVSVKARRTDGRSASWNAAVVMHVRDSIISEIWLHIDNHILLMLSSHSRPAERKRSYTNCLASSFLDSSNSLGYLALRLAENMLSVFNDLQEANQLG